MCVNLATHFLSEGERQVPSEGIEPSGTTIQNKANRFTDGSMEHLG